MYMQGIHVFCVEGGACIHQSCMYNVFVVTCFALFRKLPIQLSIDAPPIVAPLYSVLCCTVLLWILSGVIFTAYSPEAFSSY